MRPGMHAELWRLCLVGLFSFLFGWSLGYPLEILLFSIAIYMAWTFSVISALFDWIDKGLKGIPPETTGVWGEISDTLNRQKRRHTRTTEKMRYTIKRISSLTEALDEGILVLRSDLTLDWWNSATRKLLGLQSSDRGSPAVNLIRDPRFVSFINSEKFDHSLELQSPTGEPKLLEFSASYFGEGEIVLVITDVTRLRNLEQMRKEFVGNVSHELRTPLTVLRGYLETMGDTLAVDNPTIEKAFSQMSDQVARMQSLADDLILLSRLEAETLTSEVSALELYPILAGIIEEAEVLSAGKHEFQLLCPEDTTLSIREKDLHSAISNLVFNAIRHNPEGAAVQVLVRHVGNTLEILVGDNGTGIDQTDIPRLTERFYRTESSRNSSTGGTGLGLAIVKHVLQRYGGVLTINSRLGHGAQFICRFPQR